MILIWGTRGRTKTTNTGECYCPECANYRRYEQKEVRRWFTFFFIPVIPLDNLGEYVECGTCRGTYNTRILQYDPRAENAKFEAAFSVAAKRVMFKLALADGEIDQAEIDQITKAFANIAKREIAPDDIAAELEAAREDTRSVKDYLREVSGGLNDVGKETVLRSAIAVAVADGALDPSEVEELHGVAMALDLPRAYANGIFAEERIPAM